MIYAIITLLCFIRSHWFSMLHKIIIMTTFHHNIASKFVKSSSIAQTCFIFLLCTLMMSANKSLGKKNFHQVENVIKQLVHTSAVRSSRYEALVKFNLESTQEARVALVRLIYEIVKKALCREWLFGDILGN